MAYTEVDIVNLGLLRIGALPIAALTENSPNAIKVYKIWQYVRDEVLQARDWKFAIIRAELVKNTTAPLYGYENAYTLPSDFLRLKRWKQDQSRGVNPLAYSANYLYPFIDATGYPKTAIFDPPVFPPTFPYVVEALPDGTLCLFTDYDNTDDPIYINYLKRETTVARYTPTFISALAARLAAELALAITESHEKWKEMTGLYQGILVSAAAVNESYDFLEDETGSVAWENAGR